MMSFMGSALLLDQDNASSHSACATTVWFRRERVNVLDWPTCSPDLTVKGISLLNSVMSSSSSVQFK